MKWTNSLAFRIWLSINILVLTAVLTISGLYFWREASYLEESIKNEALTVANILNSAIGLYMLEGDYAKISPLTYSLQSEPNVAYIIVRDTEGLDIKQKGEIAIDQENLMIEKVPVEYLQKNVGEIEIAIETTTLQKQKNALLTDTLLTALLYSLLSLLISYAISKKLSSPINRLITATKQLTKGNHNVTLLEKSSIFEIQELAVEFNKMAQMIHSHEKILINEINQATKDLSEKVAILEVLASISNSVLEDEIQSSEVMKSTLVSVKKYIQTKQLSLTFINQNKKFEIFELDQHEQISSFELQMADTTFESAINNKQIIVRNQLQSVTTSNYEQLLFNKGMCSLLVLPITAKNKAFGTLNIANQAPSYFSKDVIDKLTVFTNQIALALDRVSAYESLQKSSYHDYLTGLPNYRLLKICIQDALEKAKQNHSLVGILFLDLDRFKMVNDTFGHATGDLLLKYIAKIIVTCLSDKETVCRIGGDEFSILLSSISEREEAVLIAKKIMKALENPVIIKGYKIPISASIGISFFSEDGTDADSLIKHADRAMYRVKQQGKNNYAIYAKNEDDQLANQIVFENELRKALTREEFVVYYQPKINIQFGTISGVEALVRWNHPDKGLIAPGNFIPQAEETGLIIEIGEFVLRQACKQCVTWQSIGFPPIPISINLSIQQFLQPTLVSTIEKVMRETDLNPALLELEITESMSMDINGSLTILQELKELGVRISIDDFGTGYSSLNYLRQLPVDRVKIDKSFINDMTVDPNNEAIVATIINMAHNLKLSVTAEGAETEEQVKYLQKHLCDEIQGYYFSKPIPAKEFEMKYSKIVKNAQESSRICI